MLKIGMQVLLYEKSSEEIKFGSPHDLVKRLYKVVGLSIDGSCIMIDLRHNQEARQAKDVKPKKGAYMENEQFRPCIRLRHTQFKALVEGIDFELNILGEIKKKEHHA